jgi:hypothetical protein
VGLSPGGVFDDILNSNYVGASGTITTSASEAKVGGSALSGRQALLIHNKGGNTVFYGPSGVTANTGIPILRDQTLILAVGDKVSVFLITANGTSTVIIQEFA